MVEAVAVVVEARLYIKVFRREAMPEEVGKWTGLGDEFSKGVVCVLCNRIAVCVEIASYVSVVVVAWNVELLSGGVRSGGVADFVVCAELGPH